MNIQINPVEITKTITSIKIEVPFILLNQQCIVRVLCYDNNHELVDKREFEMNQPYYSIWRDDRDLVNYVCEKYNFSPINIQ